MLSNRSLLVGIFIVLCLILLGGTFAAGVRVGKFMGGAHYERRFRDAGFPKDMLPPRGDFRRRDMRRHGNAGEVLSISDDTVTILTRDGTEKTLLLGSGTQVMHRRDPIDLDQITVGDHVIGLGEPDEDGNIQLKHLMLAPWGKGGRGF